MPDLKAIYRAETAEIAAAELDAFDAHWGKRPAAALRACRRPGPQRCDTAYHADAGAISLRAAHRVERRRGSFDQHTKAEAEALPAPARSVRGSHDHAAGMVRGGTVAHIARIVRAAAGGVSRRVFGRAAANMPEASQGMAARGRPSIGIRDRDGRRCWRGQQEKMPGDGIGGWQYPVDLPLRLDDASASPTTPPGPQQQISSLRGKEDLGNTSPEHTATGAPSMRQRSLAG